MARFSTHKSMLIRIGKLKRRVKIDTQRMRGNALKSLEELFVIAKKLAKDKKLELNL